MQCMGLAGFRETKSCPEVKHSAVFKFNSSLIGPTKDLRKERARERERVRVRVRESGRKKDKRNDRDGETGRSRHKKTERQNIRK